MECVERTRTGRVQSHGRTFQIEDIVDSVAENSNATARDRVRQCVLGIAVVHQLMIVVEVPHEGPGLGAGKLVKRDTRGLKRLVDNFQELSLGWV